MVVTLFFFFSFFTSLDLERFLSDDPFFRPRDFERSRLPLDRDFDRSRLPRDRGRRSRDRSRRPRDLERRPRDLERRFERDLDRLLERDRRRPPERDRRRPPDRDRPRRRGGRSFSAISTWILKNKKYICWNPQENILININIKNRHQCRKSGIKRI